MCPYLGEASNGYGYCEMSARKLMPGKVSGVCETMGYEECPSFTTDRETTWRSPGDHSGRGVYSRQDDYDSDRETEDNEEEYTYEEE